MSAVDTAVAYSPYPAHIVPRRCAASRIGCGRSPPAAVYDLSARKGSETPQSPLVVQMIGNGAKAVILGDGGKIVLSIILP